MRWLLISATVIGRPEKGNKHSTHEYMLLLLTLNPCMH
jgi:hypothetical protein